MSKQHNPLPDTTMQSAKDAMNDIIITSNDQLVTTTLAIADGTKVEHASVILLVRKYQADLEEFGEVRFEIALNPQGSPTEYAELNEQQATLILTFMRNSDIVRTFKKRLVKEFWDMRKKLSARAAFDPASLTREAILVMALDSEQGRIKAVAELEQTQKQLEVAQPKAEALDRIATFSEGSLCITNAAKDLQIQPKKLFAWLQEHQWIYRRAGGSGWVGYQSRIQVGYLEHKITTVERTDGSSKQVEQVLVTAKGLAKLAIDIDSKHGLQVAAA